MTKCRRLLFVVNVDWFFVSHRLAVGRAAISVGWEVHLATTFTKHALELEQEGFILHDIPLRRGISNPWELLRYGWRIFRVCSRLRPDLVHAVSIVPNLIGGLAMQFARVPSIVFGVSGLGYLFTRKDTAIKRFSSLAAHLLYRIVLRRKLDWVIVQNSDDFEWVAKATGLPKQRCVLIPGMGVDLNEYTPCEHAAAALPERPIVLFAARLLYDKGLREFVEAADILSMTTSARFVVVGGLDEGNPACVQAKEINRWKESGLIEWLGPQAELSRIFKSAWVYVLPSYREGFPKSIMEAAASGIPTITTDVPGCRDAIIPNVTGLLVPVADASALSSAVKELLDNPEKRMHFARNARAHAENKFDISKITKIHLDLYEDAWKIVVSNS